MVVAQEKIEWQQSLIQKSAERTLRTTRRKKKFAKGKSILLLALFVGITGSIGAETIQLTVVKGAQIHTLTKDITNLKSQNDLLQLEADKLRSVSRIESAAKSMGMEKPAGTVYVTGELPAVTNQTETPPTQVAAQDTKPKPSMLQKFSQMFTSFFASTQR